MSNTPAAVMKGEGAALSVKLSAITVFQIISSFAIQWVTVVRLGLGVQSDALFVGYTIPQVIISVVADSLIFVVVPLLASKSEQELNEDGWQLFVAIGAVFGILTVLFYFAIPAITYLIVPGLSLPAKQLAISLSKIQIFSIIGSALYAILTALYQVRHRFVWPMLSVLISSICGLIILFWALPVYGVQLAAWVQLLINTVPAILLLPILGRAHQVRLDFDLLKQVWRRMRPIMVGAIYYRTYFLGDRLLASFLTPGSIVILDMCQRVHNAIVRVLNQGIITPVVPRLAKLAEENKRGEFSTVIQQKTVEVLVSNTVILTLISICGLAINRLAPSGILRHAFGSLSPGAWTTLFVVFFYMSGLLFGSSLSHTLSTAYYAGGDTVTPTKIGIVIYTIGLALKALGFCCGGLTGIALAISFYNILYAATLRYYLKPSQWNAMEVRARSARLVENSNLSHVAPNLTGPSVIRSEPTRLIHRATDEG